MRTAKGEGEWPYVDRVVRDDVLDALEEEVGGDVEGRRGVAIRLDEELVDLLAVEDVNDEADVVCLVAGGSEDVVPVLLQESRAHGLGARSWKLEQFLRR